MSIANAQRHVREFHEAFGLTLGDEPAIRDADLRVKLLREEALEAAEAIEAGDLVKAVDGLIDTIYVCLGALVAFGVDGDPIFDEVHRTNMAKVGGTRREDGKWLKPPGWQPPRIAELLEWQRRQAIMAKGGITALLADKPLVADDAQDVHKDGGAR